MAKRVGFNDRQTVDTEITRPKDILFQPTETNEEEEYVRSTYYSTKKIVKAMEMYCVGEGIKKSEAFRLIMEAGIPKEYQDQAEEWLKQRGEL